MKDEDNGSVDYTTFTLHKIPPEKKAKSVELQDIDELMASIIRDLQNAGWRAQ